MKRHAVIYHSTDMDGWTSAWIVRKHLLMEISIDKIDEHQNGPKQDCIATDEDILYWGYNYGKSTEALERKLDDCMKEGYTIYMVDITLPDSFMEKYAEHIIWIDHHHSQIENAKDSTWMPRLRANYSQTHFEGYNGIGIDPEYGLKLAKPKIAACELCWINLFHHCDMPKFVYLSGRYDVWDHNDEVLALNAYTRYMVENATSGDKPIFTRPIFERLERADDLAETIKEGREIMKWKARFDAAEANRHVTKHVFYGVPIAVVNRGGINSQFFKAIVDKDPSIKAVSYFVYDIKAGVYRVNFFQIDLRTNVLELIENVRKNTHEGSNITTMGGHIGACGFTTTNLQADFISHLE